MNLRITSRWDAAAACDHEISHLISIQNPDADLSALRPSSIAPENHLLLLFEDLQDPDDPAGPKEQHVRELTDWISALDPGLLRGLVVHCDAGVSRSTASAWLAMVLLQPEVSPNLHLEQVAKKTLGGYCWPSDLITALADRILERNGTLIDILQRWKSAQREAG